MKNLISASRYPVLFASLAAASTGVTTERAINASVRLATRDGDASLYAETRRADGSWVHRNYLAK